MKAARSAHSFAKSANEWGTLSFCQAHPVTAPLLRPDPRDGHHPSCDSLSRAVAEQQLGMAGGAGCCRVDIFCQHTGIEQLPPVGFYQIQKEFHRQFAVAGRARGQKQQGIFFPHRIRFLDLAEQAGGVGKLRFKPGAHLFAYIVATCLYTGPDRSYQIPWIALEMFAHLADALFDDALDGAPPSCVKNSDSAPLRVRQNNRKAIGRLHRQKQARRIGDHSIASQSGASQSSGNTVDTMNQIGMNLPQ